MPLLTEWSNIRCPVIGMLHTPPLPGAPGYAGDLAAVRHAVLRDAELLLEGGVDGLMLENFGDTPFYPQRVPAITVATMTSLATDLRWRFDIPLGINCLRNDGQSALAIAFACGAAFIRVNVLCGARVADQGLLNAIAHDLLRERSALHAQSIHIWADVDVKHSVAVGMRPIEDEVRDLIDRGHADAVIVSGTATGEPTDLGKLRRVKLAARTTPVIVGSGASIPMAEKIAEFADAVIVGSNFKRDGIAQNPVELVRVRRFVETIRSIR